MPPVPSPNINQIRQNAARLWGSAKSNTQQGYTKLKPTITARYGPAATFKEQLEYEQEYYRDYGHLNDIAAAQWRNMSYERWAQVVANAPVNMRNTLETSLKQAAKLGLPVYTIFHPGQAVAFFHYLSSATSLSGIMLPAGLLSYYFLYKKARDIEYKYRLPMLKLSPEYYLQQLPSRYISHYLRKYTFKGIGAALRPIGYNFGLIKNLQAASSIPGISTIIPTFRPAYAFRQKYANLWVRIGKKYETPPVLSNTLLNRIIRRMPVINRIASFSAKHKAGRYQAFSHAAYRIANKKRERGGLNPLAMLADVLFGFVGGSLISWLERTTVGMLVSGFAQGLAKPTIKGLFSASTLSGGYLGNKWVGGPTVFKLPFVGIPVSLGGAIGGGVGWGYQTALNIARNYSTTNYKFFFGGESIYGGNLFSLGESVRRGAVPRAWNMLYNDPAALARLEREGYITYVHGSSPLYDPGLVKIRVLNARWLPQKGPLYHTVTRPAKFMFHHSWARLPLTGLAVSQLLGLNWWQTLVACGIDWGLQVARDMPTLQTAKNMGLAGAVAGMETAILTGGNPLIGAAIGGTAGFISSLAQTIGNLETLARYFPISDNYIIFDQNLPWLNAQTIKAEWDLKNLWSAERPFAELSSKFPKLRKMFNFMDARQGKTFDLFGRRLFQMFRYAKGAIYGFTAGTSLSFLLALAGIHVNPLLAGGIGAAAGVGFQFGWNRWLAPRFAGSGSWIARISAGFGRVILTPIQTFFSGADLTSFIVNAIQGIFPSGWGWAGVGFGVLGATALLTGGPLAWAAFGLGVAAEIFSRIFLHRSFFDFIFTRISYSLAAAGKTVGNIGAGIFGFLLGLFQAMTARSTDEMATGAVMMATSIATIGTGAVVIFIIGSSFFTPLEKTLYLSDLFTAIEKNGKLSNDSANQPKILTYNYYFEYKEQETDAAGQPVDGGVGGALTDVQYNDTFKNLYYKDVQTIQYHLIDGKELWNPLTSLEDDDLMKLTSDGRLSTVPFAPPGNVIRTTVILTLKRPLAEIIGDGPPLCNTFLVTGKFPSYHDLYHHTTVCLDKNGNPVALPAAEFAKYLIEATRIGFGCQPADETCQITKGKPTNPIGFLEHLAEKGYKNNRMNQVWNEIVQSTNRHACFQCVGFVVAHQLGIGNNFNLPIHCAKEIAGHDTDNYKWHGMNALAAMKEGDLAVWNGSTEQECGHVAVVTKLGGADNFYVADAAGGPPCICPERCEADDPDSCCTGVLSYDRFMTTDNMLGFLEPLP